MDGEDVSGGRIDPSRAYTMKLPSGRSIALFFYDGPISRAVAFERLLNNGEQFRAASADAFSDKRDWPQLAHIATDGETYGHHHRMAIWRCPMRSTIIESKGLARITNYAEFLELHPPATRSGDLREHRLELRARRGTLEHKLWLQFRRPRGLEPGMARSAARGSGLVARRNRAVL